MSARRPSAPALETSARRGAILILVAGICAILVSLAAAMAVRARGLEHQALGVQSEAQARICLNAALAYLIDHVNGSGRIQAGQMAADFRPALRVPLANERAASWRAGWFRILYEGSSTEMVPPLDAWSSDPATTGSPAVPLWHDVIVTIGGGPSRGLKPGESDGPAGMLVAITAAEVEIAREEEHRAWFRIRLMPPLWHQGEPYTDTNANGSWDPGEPFWELLDPPNSTYQAGSPFSDLNQNGTYDAGEPFLVSDGTGTRDEVKEIWIDTDGDGLVDPGEWTERTDTGVYAGNLRFDGGRYHLFDTRESWTDLDNDGRYDAGEPFVDSNGNGTWDNQLAPFRGWGPAKIYPLVPRSDAEDW